MATTNRVHNRPADGVECPYQALGGVICEKCGWVRPRLEVMFVGADDWHGIYIDGLLRYEGHSIPDDEWLSVLKEAGVVVDNKSESDEAYEVIQSYGRCPTTVADWNNTARSIEHTKERG